MLLINLRTLSFFLPRKGSKKYHKTKAARIFFSENTSGVFPYANLASGSSAYQNELYCPRAV
jgi:hypothetical protein